MHTNTDNTYSNRLMEQSLGGGRAARYLAASPGRALPRTKIEGSAPRLILGWQQQQQPTVHPRLYSLIDSFMFTIQLVQINYI